MNILGHIAHDSIGAVFDAEVKAGICHHAEILGFVDDNVMGFADHLCLLDSLVDISQGCQIVHVKFIAHKIRFLPPADLFFQKLPVYPVYGTIPLFSAVSSPVSL